MNLYWRKSYSTTKNNKNPHFQIFRQKKYWTFDHFSFQTPMIFFQQNCNENQIDLLYCLKTYNIISNISIKMINLLINVVENVKKIYVQIKWYSSAGHWSCIWLEIVSKLWITLDVNWTVLFVVSKLRKISLDL